MKFLYRFRIYGAEVIDSLRKSGFKSTLRHILGTIADASFDLRHGTDTYSWTSLESLDITSANKMQGVDYHPTRAAPLQRLLRTLELPREATFVDFGCGKGRAILLAMEYGFQKVVGVEFSSELCEVANKNVAIYRKKCGPGQEVEIVDSDAVDYKIRDNHTIFYFFNPFNNAILSQVLQNLRHSLESNPRPIWVVYYNPIEKAAFDHESEWLVECGQYEISGCVFGIWKSKEGL